MADPHYGRALPRVLAEASVAVLRVLDRRWRRIGQCGLAVACVALVTVPALAKPPPNADMSLAPWFSSLQQPGTGAECCSIADCRMTDSRIVDGHWQAKTPDGKWVDVPASMILLRHDNPTGRPVLCYTKYLGVMCFIKGPET